MSVDGPGLYQDDTAADVRADFKTLVAEGLSAAEATDRLLADWADVLGDDDVYCPFHLALADTQWRLGRVDPRVVERALDVLESGRDLERWEPGTSLYRRRAGVLSQLKKRLQTSPPAPRRVARQRVFETSLQVGDVFIWTAADGLRYLLGVVTHMVQDANRYAIVEVLDFDWSNGLSEESVAEAQPVRGRSQQDLALSLPWHRHADGAGPVARALAVERLGGPSGDAVRDRLAHRLPRRRAALHRAVSGRTGVGLTAWFRRRGGRRRPRRSPRRPPWGSG